MAEEATLQAPPVQQQPDPPSKKLWKALNDAEYYTKDYTAFQEQFGTPEKQKKLYDNLYEAEYYTKKPEDFSSQFFPQKKSGVGSEESQQQPEQPIEVGQIATPTSDVPELVPKGEKEAPLAKPAYAKDSNGNTIPALPNYEGMIKGSPTADKFVELVGDKKYRLGAKGIGNYNHESKKTLAEEIDCSGAVCVVRGAQGVEYPLSGKTAQSFKNSAKHRNIQLEDSIDGDLVVMDTDDNGVIDHIGFVVVDENGKRYLAESSSTYGGTTITAIEDRLKDLETRKGDKFSYEIISDLDKREVQAAKTPRQTEAEKEKTELDRLMESDKLSSIDSTKAEPLDQTTTSPLKDKQDSISAVPDVIPPPSPESMKTPDGIIEHYSKEAQLQHTQAIEDIVADIQARLDNGDVTEAEANEELQKRADEVAKTLNERYQAEAERVVNDLLAKQAQQEQQAGAEEPEFEGNIFLSFGKNLIDVFANQAPTALRGVMGMKGIQTYRENRAKYEEIANVPDDERVPFNIGISGEKFRTQYIKAKDAREIYRSRAKNGWDTAITNMTKELEEEHGTNWEEKVITDIRDIPDDGFFSSAWNLVNFIFGAAGQAMGQIPLSLATMGMSSTIMESGSMYAEGVSKVQKQKSAELGRDVSVKEVLENGWDDPAAADAAGWISGGLDLIGAKGVTKPGKDLIKKTFGKELLKKGGIEAGTEATQSAVSQFGTNRTARQSVADSFKNIDPWQMGSEAAAGFFGGTFVGARSTFRGTYYHNKKVELKEEMRETAEKLNKSIQKQVADETGTPGPQEGQIEAPEGDLGTVETEEPPPTKPRPPKPPTKEETTTIEERLGKPVYWNGKPMTVSKEGVRYVLTDDNTIVELDATESSTLAELGLKLKPTLIEKYDVTMDGEENVTVNGVQYNVNTDAKGNITSLSPQNNPDQQITNENMLTAVEIERNKTDFVDDGITSVASDDQAYQQTLNQNDELVAVDNIYNKNWNDRVDSALDKLYNDQELSPEEQLALDLWVTDAIVGVSKAFGRSGSDIYGNALSNLETIAIQLNSKYKPSERPKQKKTRPDEPTTEPTTPAPAAPATQESTTPTKEVTPEPDIVGPLFDVVNNEEFDMDVAEMEIEALQRKLDKKGKLTEEDLRQTSLWRAGTTSYQALASALEANPQKFLDTYQEYLNTKKEEAPTKKVEPEQPTADKGPKTVYKSKIGDVTITDENGVLTFRNSKGKEVTKPTQRKVALEFIIAEGNKPARLELTEDDQDTYKYIQRVADQSLNAFEIAAVYELAMALPTGLQQMDQIIADNMAAIRRKDFVLWDGTDENISGAMAKSYFNQNAQGIDGVASELSETAGFEITEDNIIDHIKRFPNRTYADPKKTALLAALDSRMNELYGRGLTPPIAQRILADLDGVAPEVNQALEDMADQHPTDDTITEQELEEIQAIFDQYKTPVEEYEQFKEQIPTQEQQATEGTIDRESEPDVGSLAGDTAPKKRGRPKKQAPTEPEEITLDFDTPQEGSEGATGEQAPTGKKKPTKPKEISEKEFVKNLKPGEIVTDEAGNRYLIDEERDGNTITGTNVETGTKRDIANTQSGKLKDGIKKGKLTRSKDGGKKLSKPDTKSEQEQSETGVQTEQEQQPDKQSPALEKKKKDDSGQIHKPLDKSSMYRVARKAFDLKKSAAEAVANYVNEAAAMWAQYAVKNKTDFYDFTIRNGDDLGQFIAGLEQRSGHPAPAYIDDLIHNQKEVSDQSQSFLPKSENNNLLMDNEGKDGRVKVAPERHPDPKRRAGLKTGDVIFRLAKGLRRRVTFKKPRARKALGTYFPAYTETRVRMHGNISTMFHEIGHALDDKYNLLEKAKDSKKALDELMHYASFVGIPEGQKNNQDYILGEGIAEYIRARMLNPTEATNRSPEFEKIVNETLAKSELRSLEQASQDIRHMESEGSLEKIGQNVDDQKVEKAGLKGLYENLKNRNRDKGTSHFMDTVLKKLKAQGMVLLVDRAYIFDESIKFLKGIQDTLVDPSADPRILAGLFNGFRGKFENMLDEGFVDANFETVTDHEGNVLNKDYLLQPFEGYTEKEIGELARTTTYYMIAQRTIELQRNIINRATKPIQAKIDDANERIAEIETMLPRLGKETKDGQLVEKEMTPEEKNEVVKQRAELITERTKLLAEMPKLLDDYDKAFNDAFREDELSGADKGLGENDIVLARKAIKEFNDLRTSSSKKHKDMVEAARRYRIMADQGLRYMVQMGRLSQEDYKNIKDSNHFYVSLARDMAIDTDGNMDMDHYGLGSTGLGTGSQVLKTLRGSSRKIKDPYAGLLMFMNQAYREADRNHVMAQYVKLIKSTAREQYSDMKAILSDIGVPAVEGDKNTTSVWVNGKEEKWVFNPELRKFFKDAGKLGIDGKVAKFFQFPARILRGGITNWPAFALRNMTRDYQQRAIVSGSQWTNLQELVRPKDKKISPTAAQRMYELYGGSQAGYYQSSPESFQRILRDQAKRMGTDYHLMSYDGMKRGWKWYKDQLQKSENYNRIQEYKGAYRHAKRKLGYNDLDAGLYAAWRARDLMDFARSGYWIGEANKYIPFLNAAIQGTRKSLATAFHSDPKVRAKAWTRYAIYSALGAGMEAVMRNALGGDDAEERYRQEMAYRKDLFFMIPMGETGRWATVPLPHELAMGAAAFKRMLALADGDKAAFDGFGESLSSSLVPIAFHDFIPYKFVAELWSNRDYYRNKEIVPEREVGLPLNLRDPFNASPLGRFVHDLGIMDARNFDHVFKASTGYLGDYVINTSKVISGQQDPSKLLMKMAGFFSESSAYSQRDVQFLLEQSRAYDLRSHPDIQKLMKQIELFWDTPDKYYKKRYEISERVRKMASKMRQNWEYGGFLKKQERNKLRDLEKKKLKREKKSASIDRKLKRRN